MAWTIKATCDRCEWPLPTWGPYDVYTTGATLRDKQPTIDDLRAALRKHEVEEHGGLSA